MKLFILPLTLLSSTAALAARGNTDSLLPSSTPASSVLATITDLPSSVTGKQYTSLASSLWSVEKSFYNDDHYTTVASHMWSAAAQASDSEKVVPSLALSTWEWDAITAAAWYDKHMPKDDKKRVSKYLSQYSDEYNKIVHGGKDGKSGDDEEGAAAPRGGNAAPGMMVVWSAAALAGAAGFLAAM